jgi:hypothetical protein
MMERECENLDPQDVNSELNSVALVREQTMSTEIGEVVPTLADRGCCVVSATDPPGR